MPPFVFYPLLRILLSPVRVKNFTPNVLDSSLNYQSSLTSFIRVESSSNGRTQLNAQVFAQSQLAYHPFALTISWCYYFIHWVGLTFFHYHSHLFTDHTEAAWSYPKAFLFLLHAAVLNRQVGFVDLLSAQIHYL